jgi:hypothetical protein
MENIKNAKSETSHSVGRRLRIASLRITLLLLLCCTKSAAVRSRLLYEVSDLVHPMFFKVYNFELI